METIFQLVTKISFGVVIFGLGSMGLMYLLKDTGFIMFLLFAAVLSRSAAILCFIALGSKLVTIFLPEILRRDWGIKIELPIISSADIRYDAFLLAGLLVILAYFYNSVRA